MKILLLLLLSAAAQAESLAPPPADTRSIEVRAKEVRESLETEVEDASSSTGSGDVSTGYGYSDLDASLNDNLFLGEKVGNLYKNPYLSETYSAVDNTNPFLSTKESMQDTNPYSGYLKGEEQYAYRDNIFLESVDIAATPSGPSLFNEYQALENRFWSGKPAPKSN